LAALQVLTMLLEASRTGKRVSRSRILRKTGVGEEAMERLLVEMRRAGYLERAERGGWLLARDLGSATLYGLFRDLGLALKPEDLALDDSGWQGNLAERLHDLSEAQKTMFEMPLRSILVGPEEGEQRATPNTLEIRPVS
jgi:membrane protein